ncbi:GntR family transcriptional regulator [Alsobacter sp. KACC 23698]|uniref:GntR family transcriptional regulator n=1 Tax=Alsobacter sp. KACC 23698 TaxID=3149229 RepID=A0AAU7JE36_9HYPH
MALLTLSTSPGPAANDDGSSDGPEDRIFRRIYDSISAQQLQPGTRLREDELGGIFGVSRARVRRVLLRLAHEGVVTIEPNRGASVRTPTVKEARELFAARRAIEAALVRAVAERFDKALKTRLLAHVKREKDAEKRRARSEMVELSGAFHMILAEAADNGVLLKYLRELITRESLVILAYEMPGRPSCSHHEHEDIVAALTAGDADRAVALMLEHLENVEARLDLRREAPPTPSLAAILGGADAS